MKKYLRIQNHQVIRKKKQKRKLWHKFVEKITLPKESTETQKVTNGPNFISKSEATITTIVR